MIASRCFTQKRFSGGKREPRDPSKPGLDVSLLKTNIELAIFESLISIQSLEFRGMSTTSSERMVK